MKRQVLLILLTAFLIETQAVVRYVTPNGTGSGTGSWANSSADLQLMINNSDAGDTVWATAGTYLPIRPADNLTIIDSNNRDNAFVLKSDVIILGGFPNTGNPAMRDRDWNTNPTILSGDIGIAGDSSDNCHHVVISAGEVGTACLDGFTITKGNANGSSHCDMFTTTDVGGCKHIGGGITILHSSPTLTNLVIEGNMADGYGSGIYSLYSSYKLTNAIVKQNSNDGIYYHYSRSPVLTNVLVVNNQGRGIANLESSPTLTNVTISKNFYGIESFTPTYSFPRIRNTIIFGNRTNTYTFYFAYNVIFQNCLVGGDTIGNGIIANSDPLFIDTANGDYRLNCFSPAIDVGDNIYIENITTDLSGNPRIYNGTVDLGAYENLMISYDSILFTPLSFTYNGTGQTPKVTTLSGTIPNLLYKEKNAPDNTYSPALPVNVGTYTVKAYLPPEETCEEIVDSVDFVILPREITVRAIDETIYYGQIPELKYEIVSGSLANGDTLSGVLYVDNYEVGTHTIKQGTLTAGSNYVITFIEGTLIVWSIQDVFVDGKLSERYKDHFYSRSECGKEKASIEVTCYQCVKILIDGVEQNPYTVSLPNYGDNNFIITVIASNGDMETHTLTINKPIPFDTIVKMHCNNTITANNNPATNGGFRFTSFKWFCNDRNFSEKQSWLADRGNEWWNASDLFYVELTAEGHSGVFRTCKGRISLKDMELRFYPNPVAMEQTLFIKGDLNDDCLKNAVIEVYDMRGRLVETGRVASLQISIGDRYKPGVYVFVLKWKDGVKEETKVIVY
ncbi:MAG: T9SS type A sorting domain-containing protein [Lentimicrobiaceae bacterium]|nr:T9SS type A sorting domain-containing protein [Lentimicrobiaceae bacterium]